MQKLRALLALPFTRHLVTLQTGSTVTMVASFLQSIIFARMLGVEGYGVYALILASAGLCSIAAGFGQQHTTTTFLAEAWSRKDRPAMRTIAQYYLQTSLIGILLLGTLVLLAPLLTDLTYQNPGYGFLARLILVSTMLDLLPAYVFIAMQVSNRFRLLTILQTFRVLLQLFLSTILLLRGYGVAGTFWGPLLTSFLFFPIMLALYEKQCETWGMPSLLRELSSLRSSSTRTYIRQGLWIAFDKHLGGNINPNAFIFLLSLTANASTVGLFTLALRLARFPGQFISPNIHLLASTTIPKVVHKGKQAIREISFKLMKGTMSLQIAITIVCLLIVPPLIPIVYGRAFAAAIPAFAIMLTMHLFAALQVATVPLLRVFDRVRYGVYVQIMSIAVALISYFLLLNIFDPLLSMASAVFLYYVAQLSLLPVLWALLMHP